MVFRAIRRVVRTVNWLLAGGRFPVEPQAGPSDCGYVCASVLLRMCGVGSRVSQIKALVGVTSRGLTLRQLRDIFRAFGVEADAIFFDRSRADAIPCPGVVLLRRGHFIVVAERFRDSFEIYDPTIGWYRCSRTRLARQTQGFGISVPKAAGKVRTPRLAVPALPLELISLFGGRRGALAAGALLLAQLVSLCLPLLSQRSIDALTSGVQVSTLGAVGAGFVLLSAVSALTRFVSGSLSQAVIGAAATKLGGFLYNRLANQPAEWFDLQHPSTIVSRINSVRAQFLFLADGFRVVVGCAFSAIIGMCAFLFISPWLALPGLCGAAAVMLVELAFSRSNLALISAHVDASQRQNALDLDILTQIPLLQRAGAQRQGRSRYVLANARVALLDEKLQRLLNWRTLTIDLVRSADMLVYLCLAAVFMSDGHYSLGAFVAVGAYKDLFAQSISQAFQLHQRYRATEVHRHQSNDLIRNPGGSDDRLPLKDTTIEFDEVSFAYGKLDRTIIQQLSFSTRSGECLVVRGPSGSGKSTIAKLIVGACRPASGSVRVGGVSPASATSGVGAVLQSDRIISGTIRDNIALFRRDISDEQIYAALKLCKVDDFVHSLPMKLNTHISEASGGLSGGQRQRLLLTRAMVGRPSIVVLDEATASLEVEVEAQIIRGIIATGSSVVLISHRPEVWRLASSILDVSPEGNATYQRLIIREADPLIGNPAPTAGERNEALGQPAWRSSQNRG